MSKRDKTGDWEMRDENYRAFLELFRGVFGERGRAPPEHRKFMAREILSIRRVDKTTRRRNALDLLA